MSFIIESNFVYKNHRCVVVFTDLGHRCGYVAITKENPFYKLNYNEEIKSPKLLKILKEEKLGKRGIIPAFCWDGENVRPDLLFNVHGGITYSGNNNYPIKTKEALWWLGFDCGHYNDAKDFETLKILFPKEYEKVFVSYSDEFGTIRTKSYVEQECKNLVDQIIKFSAILK